MGLCLAQGEILLPQIFFRKVAMNSPKFSFQLLQLIFLSTTMMVAARFNNFPKLNPIEPKFFENSDDTTVPKSVSEDFKTFYYNQTLDHFNYMPESYTNFQQKYVMNFKYWGGANASAPIIAYLGAESPLYDSTLTYIGFLTENAAHFNALLVYIEHRYYGNSSPFSPEELKNAITLGYFSSAQAIADYAEILMYIKKKYSAHNSPVVVVGGSYGGMLAAWFRLKYPHVALGALASSAPILYFDDLTPHNGYFSVVTKDFKEASETCYQTIKESWEEIDKVSLMPNGLSILSKKFNICSPLNDPSELKDFLGSVYTSAAQYNKPPTYRVNAICDGIDGASFGNDTLSRIYAGLRHAYSSYGSSCYYVPTQNKSIINVGWGWQTCSDMVLPLAHGNGTMFPSENFDLDSYIKECKDVYGVPPRPNWVTTYYGGDDIKLILKRFGSNIIFSNGLKDPWSIGGVLEDISESIVAVHTAYGSHCLDILASEETDPEWLVEQRKIEVKIIDSWIAKYYSDLQEQKT